MSNRLTRRRQAIIGGGCIFAACLLLLIAAPGAQAATLNYDISASGAHIIASGSMQWEAGTHDLYSIPPLDCAGEYLAGGHETRVIGSGTYQTSGALDATEIMTYQHQTGATLGQGIWKEGLFVDGCGSPWSEAICGVMPEGQEDELAAATAYCSGASFSSYAMGRALTINSAGATVQASAEYPDSLAAMTTITGDGMGKIKISSWNGAGIGNTTGAGYLNKMEQKVMADGPAMQVGGKFAWTSFANLWQDEPEGEE